MCNRKLRGKFDNGGIEHRFQTSKDLPPSRIFGNQPLPGPFNNNDWFNGKEIYSRKFKKNPNGSLSTVEEANLVYKTHPLFSADFTGYTGRRNRISRAYDCDSDEEGVSYVDVMTYSVQKRFNYLDSLSVKAFDQQSHEPIIQNSVFRYDSKNLQLSKKETENSVGCKLSVQNTYNTDLPINVNNSVFVNLRNLNVSIPIEVLKISRRSDGSEWVQEGLLTTYKAQAGKAFVDKICTLDLASPILLDNFVRVQLKPDGSLGFDTRYLSKLHMQLYDLTGNVLQRQLPDQTYKTTIYDYNASLPVAEIDFAEYSNCAYTSFESNGTGNWLFGGTSLIDVSAPTGRQVYKLSQTNGSIFSGPLQASQAYKLTYWLKNGSGNVLVNGISGSLIASKGIWQLYEKTISGITALTISGTGIIDELRLAPVNAKVSTATYDPLFGVTSYCNERNNISYYYYDALGKLVTIKDQDGNIIKQADYQYQVPLTK